MPFRRTDLVVVTDTVGVTKKRLKPISSKGKNTYMF